jgi:hypothetical protein
MRWWVSLCDTDQFGGSSSNPPGKWTINLLKPIIHSMSHTVEQVVREYRKASRMVLRECNTPEKARAFLIKAGILERHSKSPNGVRLAKPFR